MAGDILRVGATSMAAIPGNTEENISKIKEFTKQAIEEKIELLLFPELSVSGYWTDTELHYEAEPIDGESIRELTRFLRELDSDIGISVGLAEAYGGTIYNCQVLLDRTGVLYYYRKTHWPHAEMGVWSCGDRYPVHHYKGINLGTAICYDNSFPEVHRIYGLKGADLVLSPYAYGSKFDRNVPSTVEASIKKWKDKEKMFLRAAAHSNYTWIVSCVGGGHVKDYKAESGSKDGSEYYFPGVILFIEPNGNVVKESPDDSIEERLLWTDISKIANIEARRGTNNYFKNRRTATYGRITELP
ncbi:MAG: nitrilase-related carbon-nitrogen hydrolase [Promethearchaeota archaeon]